MNPVPLEPQDLLLVTRSLPAVVTGILKKHPGRVLLAGGFIRAAIAREEPADIDLIVDSPELAAEIATSLKIEQTPNGVIVHRVFTSDNAHTVYDYGRRKLPIQIIHRWTYATPEQTLESFDFTIACAAVIWDVGKGGWRGLAHEQYYSDLAAKRLRYLAPTRSEDAGGSMLRVLKFYQRGYRIPLPDLGAVVARLAFAVRQNSLTETEAGMARVLTALLVEVDPLIDPDHIMHDPANAAEEGP